MLHVKVLSFKCPPLQPIAELEADYLKRLKHFAKVELPEVNSTRFAKLPPEQLIAKEAELLKAEVSPSEYQVALCETGHLKSSEELASWIQNLQNTGKSKVTFILGSPHGLSRDFIKGTNYQLSLSPLTFTSQFARLILLEQLYRAFAINNNLPYHKAGL
jgi:23S rRNA (pseudouridine1915-N3)-methyltransferase